MTKLDWSKAKKPRSLPPSEVSEERQQAWDDNYMRLKSVQTARAKRINPSRRYSATADSLLVRVVAPDFVAGLIVTNDFCVRAAPILKWAVGKRRDHLRILFTQNGWNASVVQKTVERACG